MSFSSAPDTVNLGRVAGELAVDESFVEKDWYVVQAISALIGFATPDITPVFSGGTSLLKGYQLIKRFSEDIDFKLSLSAEFLAKTGSQKKAALSLFKKSLEAGWATAGFTVTSVEAGSGNAFIKIEMNYPTVLGGHDALRPHILAELSAKPPRWPTIGRPLSSFVAQYRRAEPEVAVIQCVDPLETAADKLSAFSWRAIARDRNSDKDDPTIVRHLHDLAMLEPSVSENDNFPALLLETLIADSDRGGGGLAALPPVERLNRMLEVLDADEQYEAEYTRFVEGMAFAGDDAIPNFRMATEAVNRLSALLSTSLGSSGSQRSMR
ncbi:nucleotidyl transferase AbiEii/AbiGii toxin family protein [Sphingomonas sp.]|uniref:nucleotidyl transferase AbiEii/AbiGii toxin family protein n=1 Tax=Sphingomonas sp. TaxID=28214 RepID=UPI0025D65852|nr:nucleotidyl transferase AbiEii/AbiGii toxin family protein [Sphingomonas sp.]